MANSNKRPIVVIQIKKLGKMGDFILKTRTILLNITNNPGLFASPDPDVAVVTGNVDDLEAAETLAKTRVVGSVSARDLKYDVVLKNVHALQSYVQKLADNAADEATAISIITASGFDVKSTGTKTKAPLAARSGAVSGTVNLIAKSTGERSFSNWRQSSDNTTWTELPPTMQLKTVVTGLTPATVVYFQHRAITKTGVGNWSQSVSVVVQ